MFKKRLKPFHRIKRCPFCKGGNLPDYKEVETLSRFITERGKIISCLRTGVCDKHQRKLAREIKRTRHLALLPFIARI